MGKSEKSISAILAWATSFLAQKGIENPRLEAEILLSFSLNLGRLALYLSSEQPLKKEALTQYKRLLKRRGKGEPLTYLTEEKEFWSLSFKVTPAVLIPRPETETLVEEALKLLSSFPPLSPIPRVLELGTGCGAIAITLAKEVERLFLLATDISLRALRIAQENALRHGVEKKVLFLAGDLFSPLREMKNFDLIISNPPYIPTATLEKLPLEISKFEPRLALEGGREGMDFYQKIVKGAPSYLKDKGWILLELGENQGKKLTQLMKEIGKFSPPEIVKDLAGKERVVKAQRL